MSLLNEKCENPSSIRTNRSFMNGWKNSPSHNANMLNGSFKAIGISVFAAKTAYGYTYFAVQNFGR